MDARLHIEGLDELRRELRRANLGKRLGQAHKRVAEFVADRAERRRSTLRAQYPSYRKVRLKPSAAQKYAQVIVGHKGVGHAAEFGAMVHPVFGRPRPQASFKRQVWPPWGGNDETAGYMVYPTIREHSDEIVDIYGDAVAKELRPAFPEGREA